MKALEDPQKCDLEAAGKALDALKGWKETLRPNQIAKLEGLLARCLSSWSSRHDQAPDVTKLCSLVKRGANVLSDQKAELEEFAGKLEDVAKRDIQRRLQDKLDGALVDVAKQSGSIPSTDAFLAACKECTGILFSDRIPTQVR